jgi:hypothetical protein
MNESVFFKRPDLAIKMARTLLSTSPASASASGLFLSAPRRTGKSTFVREDLRPALEAQGAEVLYVDLWANKQNDPGDVIMNEIRATLARNAGVLARLVKSSGFEKLSLGGASFALDKLGLEKGISVSAALSALSDESGKPIVLIIDEAQHAITTPKGSDALFALKAARDELNSSRHHGLRVVATGSNQDKLAMLRSSKDQAFFGAPMVKFPPLGKDYVEWYCEFAGSELGAVLDVDKVYELFVQAAFRPEILGGVVDLLRHEYDIDVKDVAHHFYTEVPKQIEATNQSFLSVVRSLTPLQSSVLHVLADAGANYTPFDTTTVATCQALLSKIAPESKVRADIPNIQKALEALQQNSLVWKAARGVYALEDTSYSDLLLSTFEDRFGPINKSVSVGSHHGMVVRITSRQVFQRVNPNGATVCHDASKMSSSVRLGDVIDVRYRDGVGEVSGLQRGSSLDR